MKHLDNDLREEVMQTERQIKMICPAKDEYDLFRMARDLTCEQKNIIRSLLGKRATLLNRMLLCTPAEIARMKDVNDRLYNLTNRLYDKTYKLYIGQLKTGNDPEFDDDIMFEGTLRYVVDDWEEGYSVLTMPEDREYGSDFKWMMSLICELSEQNGLSACARTLISYSPKHNPDITPKELGLDNVLDDGESWDHHGLFKDICICNAVYHLTDENLFSYPDVLRMNDFWCEVKITHQLFSNIKGAAAYE